MTETLVSRVANLDVLTAAWHQVRSNGLASKSQNTRQAVRDFEVSVESRLAEISEQIASEVFDFGPAKGVLIPRPGKEPRPLLVASLPARIVQRALLDVLQACEGVRELSISSTSFGGVPGGSVSRAIRAACEAIASGKVYHLRSDIAGFFTRIPRSRVIELVNDVLPDQSLNSLLDSATNLEISNREELGEYEALMPDEYEGIAQGCCLSPLLGNILLHQFDSEMNSDTATTLRYIDDFLILGPDRVTVLATAKAGDEILKDLGMCAYSPTSSPGKASAGPTRRGIEFLGCWITDRVVEPSRSARRAFLSRVETEIRHARVGLKHAAHGNYERSLVSTLLKVSRMIEGWTKQYSFCNPTKAFESVDVKTDRYVRGYLDAFFSAYRKGRASMRTRRRLLGVWLASDAERVPILPLDR